MGSFNPVKKTTQNFDIQNYPGKIARRDDKTWVKVCPKCFSPKIKPLMNISGTIIHDQWVCPECNYAGVVIEVHFDDLAKLQLLKYRKYNSNKKVSQTQKETDTKG